MKELSLSEKLNLNWLYSVLTSKDYTPEFKKCARKNIAKFENRK